VLGSAKRFSQLVHLNEHSNFAFVPILIVGVPLFLLYPLPNDVASESLLLQVLRHIRELLSETKNSYSDYRNLPKFETGWMSDTCRFESFKLLFGHLLELLVCFQTLYKVNFVRC